MQQPKDHQISFVDWALAQRTRPNEILVKIDALVDLSEAERRLEKTYSPLGRPGHRAAVIFVRKGKQAVTTAQKPQEHAA